MGNGAKTGDISLEKKIRLNVYVLLTCQYLDYRGGKILHVKMENMLTK